MDRIEQTYTIAATPDEVWEALTDPRLIAKWSGAPASYPLEPGARYSLWGGDIGGQIVELVSGERLVQTWQPKNWGIENSTVTFVLRRAGRGTRVDLIHENVEPWDFEGTSKGWDLYYLGAIKRMLDTRRARKSVLKATEGKRRGPAPATKKGSSKQFRPNKAAASRAKPAKKAKTATTLKPKASSNSAKSTNRKGRPQKKSPRRKS